MEAVNRAKGRMLRFPRLLSLCAEEGNAYALCILAAHEAGGAKGTGVMQGKCVTEFQALKRCALDAAKKAGTRM